MNKRQRLTNNSDETDLTSLLSGDVIFAIPYFQRAYKWKPERLHQLNRDLLSLVDESSDFHFLGAVIIHGRRTNPSDPDVYDVIDGQQRITTIFLYLCAVVRTLCKHEQYTEAAGLLQKYLVIVRNTSLNSNAKLHSCKDDRAQLNRVLEELMSSPGLNEAIKPFTYSKLTATGSSAGRLWKNYRMALRFFEGQVAAEGLPRLQALYKALLESMSVVQIDVWDPTNGPKIFDSLNSRQEPMTTGDLVRNEIFSRVADYDPEHIEKIDEQTWQPFYNKFREDGRDLFDSYFFPYGLIQDPNLRKSDVYAKLRDSWSSEQDPGTIVVQLTKYQDAFLDLLCGTNRQNHNKEVYKAFKTLYKSNLPSSTLPFLMQLSEAVRSERVASDTCVSVLKVVESFLVRRAICGHEPTGLHAVFKRLWSECSDSISASTVSSAIKKHRTVVWPNDNETRTAIESRPLYGANITPFILGEWNQSLGGDQPNIIPWIEHVLPKSPVPSWNKIFSNAQQKEQIDLLANLLPLSSEMNISLSNKEYSIKQQRYEEDAAFKATRQFAKDYKDWTPADLIERGELLSKWAIERW